MSKVSKTLQETCESVVYCVLCRSVQEVEELVIINDNLRAQEIKFREDCRKELEQLQNAIK